MPRKTLSGQPLPTPRTVARRPMPKRVQHDPNTVYPATRQEIMPIALASVILAFLALLVSASRGWMLLYGDAVAHLGIARRILDARYPGLAQLGGVWLPLPHLLILPFVQRMDWWQNGIAGAWPSLAAYVMGNAGCYALARKIGHADVGVRGDGVLCAESEPAVPVVHGDDRAAVSRTLAMVHRRCL